MSSACESLVFFSSRRRHTRFKCDWSSDVCSSDLVLHSIKYDDIWYCAREARVSLVLFSYLALKKTTVKSESKSAVTRLLPDQYLSNSVILFTTNLFFILSNMMKCGPRRPQVNYCDISNIQLRTKRTQPVVA